MKFKHKPIIGALFLGLLMTACGGRDANDELTDFVYQDFQNIIAANEAYSSEKGVGVDSINELLTTQPELKTIDPWGSLYVLNSVNEITLYSLGPDKVQSEDDIYYEGN